MSSLSTGVTVRDIRSQVVSTMNRLGFFRPNLPEVAAASFKLSQKIIAGQSGSHLTSKVYGQKVGRTASNEGLFICLDLGGSNLRVISGYHDNQGQCCPENAVATTNSLRVLKKVDTTSEQFTGLLKSCVEIATMQISGLQKKFPSLPISIGIVWSNALIHSGNSTKTCDPLSYRKPDFHGIAVPEDFNLQNFFRQEFNHRLGVNIAKLIIENDSALLGAITHPAGRRPDIAEVLCTGLGIAAYSAKDRCFINTELGFRLTVKEGGAELLLPHGKGSSPSPAERAEDFCSGDKLIELLDFWVKAFSQSKEFPELNKFTEQVLQNRTHKRRIISRTQAVALLKAAPDLENNLESLNKIFHLSEPLSEKHFAILATIAQELFTRAREISAACIAGMAGNYQGQNQVAVNLDSTVCGNTYAVQALESKANEITSSLSFPEISINLVKPQDFAGHRAALSSPMQGIFELLGLATKIQ